VTVAPAQPPTVSQLLSNNATSLAQLAGNTVSGLVGDMVLVFIYVAFLIVTAGSFATKLDRIFVRPSDRQRANLVGAEVRRAMEQYLWVQTALSIIATCLTYVTLLVIGLDNALFWAFVIFVLNYIPTVGSIIATVLPSLFAVVQPQSSWPGWMPDDSLLCGRHRVCGRCSLAIPDRQLRRPAHAGNAAPMLVHPRAAAGALSAHGVQERQPCLQLALVSTMPAAATICNTGLPSLDCQRAACM